MEYLIPVLAIVLIFGPRMFKEVKDFLLKREQIRADAHVRAEALRLKNEIELEKLIRNDNTEKDYNRTTNETGTYNKEHKPDNKMRY